MATQRTTKRPSRSTTAVLNDNGIDVSGDASGDVSGDSDATTDGSRTSAIDQDRAETENEKVEGLNPVMKSDTPFAAKDRF